MIELQGKYTSAKIFTDNVEQEVISQVFGVCNHPAFENSPIRIQADTHAGKGCVIGFTAKLNDDKVIPNLIGVDIGCGMTVANLGKRDICLNKLDNTINKIIPTGFNVNDRVYEGIPSNLKDKMDKVCRNIGDSDKFYHHLKAIGSLGSGNHFIELGINSSGESILTIHSGSRNFGHKIATYYQKLAMEKCKDKVKRDLTYLEGQDSLNYLEDMRVAQSFASVSREVMLKRIIVNMIGVCEYDYFETIHNYISDDNIIRKGAISAKKDELVIIPINMRDGSIIAKGLGNEDYNLSAPHGAGRVMSRSKAKENLSLDEFKDTMKDVYSTSIGKSTLDEAPMAYKPIQEIIDNTKETIEIVEIIKSVYNFKDH